jgi:hypothetical protein
VEVLDFTATHTAPGIFNLILNLIDAMMFKLIFIMCN